MRDSSGSIHAESIVEFSEFFSEFFDLLQRNFAEFGLDRDQGGINGNRVDEQLLPLDVDHSVQRRLFFADLDGDE